MTHQQESRQSQLLLSLIPPSTINGVPNLDVFPYGYPSFSVTHQQEPGQSQLLLSFTPPSAIDGVGPAYKQIVRIAPRIAPRPVSTTSPVSKVLAVGNSDSALQRRAPWRGCFSYGCSFSQYPDMYAERLVSCAPWDDRSVVDQLAEMFREEYCRASINPWVVNEATSKVTTFLEAVEKWMRIKRSGWAVLEFHMRLGKVALNGFRLSMDFGNVSDILKHSCYLGALFDRVNVIKYVLARVAEGARRAEHFQAFYYLLSQVIVELPSDACAMQEILEYVTGLRDILNRGIGERNDPRRSLLWYNLIVNAIAPYLK